MQALPSNAIQNNQRLFGPFSRKLATDDLAVYATFADKFALWLRDERAYYLEARPEILKIAQSTLRRNVGANPDLKSLFHISSCIEHPMVAPYSRLLRAIHPFRERFVEPDLQGASVFITCPTCVLTLDIAEIKALLKTITAPNPNPSRPVSIDLTMECVDGVESQPKAFPSDAYFRPHSPSSGVQMPVIHNGGTMTQPSPSSLSSALQIQFSPPLSVHSTPGPPVRVKDHSQTSISTDVASVNGKAATPLPSATGYFVKTAQAGPLVTGVSAPTQNSFPGPSKESEQDTSTPSTQPPGLSQTSLISTQTPVALKQSGSPAPRSPILASTSSTEPAFSKPKKKKKKKLDLELQLLIQADLQELRKRGASGLAIKQELIEPTDLTGGLATPSTQNHTRKDVSDRTEHISVPQATSNAPSEVTTARQPEVIVLDRDDAAGSSKAQDPEEVDLNLVVDGMDNVPTFPVASSDASMHVTATDIPAKHDNGNAMAIDETAHAPPPLHKGYTEIDRAYVEDIDMANGTAQGSLALLTKADALFGHTQPAPAPPLFLGAGLPPLPLTNTRDAGLASTSAENVVSEQAPSVIVASVTLDNVLDAMVTETAEVKLQGFKSTSPREIHDSGSSATVGADTTHEVKQTLLIGKVLENALEGSSLPLNPEASSQPDPLFMGSTKELRPTLNTFDTSPDVTVTTSSAVSAPSQAVPVASRAISRPSLKVLPDWVLPSQSLTGVQPTLTNGMTSAGRESSHRPPLPSWPASSAHKTASSIETSALQAPDGIVPAPEPTVKVYTADELKALNAFSPQTTVLAIHKGLNRRSKVTIRFDIPEKQFQAVNLWSMRKTHTKDLKESICLSLSCYSRVAVKAERKSIEEVSELPSIWPMAGGLVMNVMFKGKTTTFPLSPPFIVAPNGLVDLSEFISAGRNTIELDQTTDMSAYILVLRAHNPTGAQLQQVALRRQKNLAWNDWLVKMARPLDVPLPPFS
ncbi:hypothetical protein D9615_001705 [Tricholomella constricta]|uniref:Uncharacterized protein n=1 Tax=Tricholomella constricta TaxID=117010 RepID=A0A8H5HNZ5_9AGAR|nr:hypothetical protein D9615_001705 [Tricholomella constricta]